MTTLLDWERKKITMEEHQQQPPDLPQLPIEIVQRIVECVIPKNPPVAFDRKNTVTKTLLSFSRTCKATSVLATSLLLQHCLYIDHEDQLEAIVQMLESDNAQLAMCAGDFKKSGVGLYLYLNPESTAEDEALAALITPLFEHLSPYIRRLVLDEGDLDCRGEPPVETSYSLREALTLMPMLEEFSCDEDFTNFHCNSEMHQCHQYCESEGWSGLPRLRRLALCFTSLRDDCFDAALKTHRGLEHLVLAAPRDLHDSCRETCFRQGGLNIKRLTVVDDHESTPYNWGDWLMPEESSQPHNSTKLQLEVHGEGRAQQEASVLEAGVALRSISLPHEDVWCTFVVRHALAGTLWDLEGRVITPGKCQCLHHDKVETGGLKLQDDSISRQDRSNPSARLSSQLTALQASAQRSSDTQQT